MLLNEKISKLLMNVFSITGTKGFYSNEFYFNIKLKNVFIKELKKKYFFLQDEVKTILYCFLELFSENGFQFFFYKLPYAYCVKNSLQSIVKWLVRVSYSKMKLQFQNNFFLFDTFIIKYLSKIHFLEINETMHSIFLFK